MTGKKHGLGGGAKGGGGAGFICTESRKTRRESGLAWRARHCRFKGSFAFFFSFFFFFMIRGILGQSRKETEAHAGTLGRRRPHTRWNTHTHSILFWNTHEKKRRIFQAPPLRRQNQPKKQIIKREPIRTAGEMMRQRAHTHPSTGTFVRFPSTIFPKFLQIVRLELSLFQTRTNRFEHRPPPPPRGFSSMNKYANNPPPQKRKRIRTADVTVSKTCRVPERPQSSLAKKSRQTPRPDPKRFQPTTT